MATPHPDPFVEGGPLEAAYFTLSRLDLPLPPIPAAFLPFLEQRADAVWSTHPGVASLADLDPHIADAAAGHPVPWFALSLEGYGANNTSLRLASVEPAMAVFLELPLGGPYADPVACRNSIEQSFRTLVQLLERASSPAYAIDHRGPRGSRWCEVGGPWHTTGNGLDAVLARLHGF